MKRKIFFGFLIAVLASGLMIAGCDIFPEEEQERGSSDYEPLIIKGRTINGDDVEIEITRKTSRAVLTPQNGDTFVLRINGVETSRGTIQIDETRITFYPTNGQPFVASYTSGDEIITLYEIPDENGDLTTGLGHSNPGRGGGNTDTAAAEAKKLATRINDNSEGEATASGAIVTLDAHTTLKASLEIPAGVTLVVPEKITLTVNGSDNTDDTADPDSDVAKNIYNPAGSGSWQITGSGTLDVNEGGTLAARNRTLRVAKTILRPGAVYTLWYWKPGGFVNAGNLTDSFTLESGTLEIAYAPLPQQVGILADFYTFTLKGVATVPGEFKFADSSNTLKDMVVIENGGVLTLKLGDTPSPPSQPSGGTITSGGKVQVRSGGKIIFNPNNPPKAPAIGDGSVEVLPGGILEIATDDKPANNMKVIGATAAGYMYQIRSGSIEMKPKSYPSPDGMPLFEYIFNGAVIARTTAQGGGVWMDVDYTIKNRASLTIPLGSRAYIVGIGFMYNLPNGPDKRTIPFGTLTVETGGTLTVNGILLLDGTGATLTVPSNAPALTNENIGILDMNNQGLVNAAIVKKPINWVDNVLKGEPLAQ